MSDPKVIYLGPACEAETGDGRTWAEDSPWPGCECGHRPVQYVLGETFYRMKAEREALQARLTVADQRVDDLQQQLAATVSPTGGEPEVVGYGGLNHTGSRLFRHDGLVAINPEQGGIYQIPVYSQEYVTRLQAEVEQLNGLVARQTCVFCNDSGELLTKVSALQSERDVLKAEVSIYQNEYVKYSELEQVQSELTKARELLTDIWDDGELLCAMTSDAARRLREYQSAPATNFIVCNVDESCGQSAPAAKASTKTCIECDQPYCHGVCVERGDDCEDYLSREIRDGDQP